MPIPPPPLRLHCPRCGWHTVWAPRSDALSPDDLPPSTCPRCGHEPLQAQRATSWEVVLQRGLAWLQSKQR